MYSFVSQPYIETILGDSRKFTTKLFKKNNTNGIYEEMPADIKSILYYASGNSGDIITLGSTVATYIEVEMSATGEILENNEIKVEIGLLLPNETIEFIPVGYFTVEKPATAAGITKFTAYDRMLKFNKATDDKFPVKDDYTADSLLEMIGGAVGVKIVVPEELKGTKYGLIYRWQDTYTYREAISYFASYYGYFAIMNRDGELEFKWYKDIEYPVGPDRYFSFERSDIPYKVARLDCIMPTSGENNWVYSSGTGTKGISFTNPVISQSRLDKLYDVLAGMTYQPANIKMVGDIRLDVGDILTVTDEKGLIYSVPVMNLTFEYDGGLSATVEAVGESDAESEVEFAGPTEAKIDRVVAKVNGIASITAEKADITQLSAVAAEVGNLSAKAITTENLTAAVANITNLTANDAIIKNIKAQALNADSIKAAVVEVGYITAESADIRYASVGALDVLAGRFNSLDAKAITADNLSVKAAEAGYIKAEDADLKYASIARLMAAEGRIDSLSAKAITTENLTSAVANITNLTANDAIIKNIKAQALSIDSIKTAVADVGYITATEANARYLTADSADIRYLSSESANLKYAHIDFANVEKESVGLLLAGVGLISSAVIKEGHVTGYLDAVDINADRIKAGTLSVDRLVINGTTDSIIYALNNAGELQSVHCDTLDGGLITKRSITADHIVAKSITANEIDVSSIFAQNIIATGTITGAELYGGYFESGNGVDKTVIENGYISSTGNGGFEAVSAKMRILYSRMVMETMALQSTGYYYGLSIDPDSMKFHRTESSKWTNTLPIFTVDIYNDIFESRLAENNFLNGVSAKQYIEDGTPLADKYAAFSHTHSYLPLTGGTLSGGLIVGGKVKAWTDNEGGNIQITSSESDGKYYQMDACGGNFRVFYGNSTAENTASFGMYYDGTFHTSGNVQLANAKSVVSADGKRVIYQDTASIWVGVEEKTTYIATKNYACVRRNGADYVNLDSGNYGSYALPLSGGELTGWLNLKDTNAAYSYTAALNIYNSNNSGYARLFCDKEGGTIELKSATGNCKYHIDTYLDTELRLLAYNGSSYNEFRFGTNGVFKAPQIAISGTLNGCNIAISGTLNGYNIGGVVANNNNGLVTGGTVYNALGSVQIIEILNTGLLSTSSAIANGSTATLSTAFTMWQGSTNFIVIPIAIRYCNVDGINLNSTQDALNITVRNTSGASHTLSGSFLIIYYKYK